MGRRQVLVIGPAWIGDMVMAQSLFMALKGRTPQIDIDVVAPPWSLPLLSRMPEVREAIALDVGHGRFGLLDRWRLGVRLRQRHYDQAIVLPRSFKAALVPFFAHIPQRTGYLGEMRYGVINDMRQLDKEKMQRLVERYVALGCEPDEFVDSTTIPSPALQIDPDNKSLLIKKLGLHLERPVIAFMPGAEYGKAKRWPSYLYAQLASHLRARGYQVWLLGASRDRLDAEEIATAVPGVINLCGKTQLTDAVDLLSLSAAAVTNDSGLMHLAAAVGIPLVAIYGSSTPDYTPPLSGKARVIYRRLECSPCFKRSCQFDTYDCLRQIRPDVVLANLLELLEDDEV